MVLSGQEVKRVVNSWSLVSQGREHQNKLLIDLRVYIPWIYVFQFPETDLIRETRERCPYSSSFAHTALVEVRWLPQGILASVLLRTPVAPVPWIDMFN